MNVKIICDVGSCHGNNLDYFKRAITVAKDLGVELKCQLFGDAQATSGNMRLSTMVFAVAVKWAEDAGVPMFASVWDADDYQCLRDHTRHAVKFAYSQRKSPLIDLAVRDFVTVYVSGQHIDCPEKDPANLKRLLCIPQYPVYTDLFLDYCFQPHGPFTGFSDHTLGISQSIESCMEGARVIEKHVKFDGYTDCPDARFAINEAQLTELVKYVK